MLTALHIAFKDLRVLTRDPSAMGILLGMPIVLILILGSALGGGGEDMTIKVAVVNQDRGGERELGAEMVEALKDSERLGEIFEIEWETDARKVRDAVATGEYVSALIIPKDFSERIETSKPVELVVYKDPGSALSADIWQGVVDSFAAGYSSASIGVRTVTDALVESAGTPGDAAALPGAIAKAQADAIAETTDGTKLITIDDGEDAQAREMTALDYYAVSMTSMFLMFGAMFGAFTTIRERREQTLARLQAAPVAPSAIIAGRMAGVFVMGMAQFVVLYVFSTYALRVDWGADVLAIFVIAAGEVAAVTGFAVFISSLTKTERGAGGLGPLVIQIQALIGGAFFQITILPEWIQPIRYASVIGWSMEGWQTVQMRAGTLADVTTPLLALFGFAAAFFAFGAVMAGRRA